MKSDIWSSVLKKYLTAENMKIYVLTENGIPRRKEIINETKIKVNVYNSSSAVDFIAQDNLVDQDRNVVFLGRKLTNNEKKCLLSHNSVIKSFKDEWNIVFEDDAIINYNRFSEFAKTLSSINIKKPTILLLYIGVHGVFVRKKSRIFKGISAHKCLALPSGAVGYAMNLAASRIIQNCTTLTGTADWPTWSRLINYYGVLPAMIHHDFSAQSITQVGAPDSKISFWPKERYKISRMLFGCIRSKQLNAYGGFFGYIRINFLAALFRRVSSYLSLFFIRT
jgi:GR25 family glycosyltransferase involved in LPS biosynthesis